MDYSDLSSSIASLNSKLNSDYSSIKNVDFSQTWDGDAYSSFISSKASLLSNISSLETDLSNMSSCLSKTQEYVENYDTIGEYQDKLRNTPDTEENEDIRSYYQRQITYYESLNETKRNEINALLQAIGLSEENLTSDVDISILYSASSDGYAVDIFSLLEAYQNHSYNGQTLKVLGSEDSLYNYGVTSEELEQTLLEVKNTYSSRYVAVNSALVLLQTAVDNGVILGYDNTGFSWQIKPYNSTASIVKGSDCSAFVSWCIDKAKVNVNNGTYTGGYEWRTVEELYNAGTKIDYENWSEAQPGDVFSTSSYYSSNSPGRHTGIIIYNDVENETFITAEASGSQTGIVLKTRTYSELASLAYTVNDMTAVYDGTVDTDKKLMDGNDNYVREF